MKSKVKEPKLPGRITEIINNVRNGIPKISNNKQKAVLMETLLEKILNKSRLQPLQEKKQTREN